MAELIKQYEDEIYRVKLFRNGPAVLSVVTQVKATAGRKIRRSERKYFRGRGREYFAERFAANRLKELAAIREEMRACGDFENRGKPCS